MPGKRKSSRPRSHHAEATPSFRGPTELLADCVQTPELRADSGPPPTELQGELTDSPQISEIDTTQATAGSPSPDHLVEDSRSQEAASPSTSPTRSPIFESLDEYPLFTPLLQSFDGSSFFTREASPDPEEPQFGECRHIQAREVPSLYANDDSITRPSIAGPLVDADFEDEEPVSEGPVPVCSAQILTVTKATPVLRRVGRLSRDMKGKLPVENKSKGMGGSNIYGSETLMNSLIASLQRPTSPLNTIVDLPKALLRRSSKRDDRDKDSVAPLQPLKSCLRRRVSPGSSSPSTPSAPNSSQRRRVSFKDNSELFGPRIVIEDFDSQELAQQRRRVTAHERLYKELRRTCLDDPRRFILKLSENMSDRRRQYFMNVESVNFWKWLRENACINFASDTSQELPFRMMEKMFRLIWAHVFVSLPERGQRISQADKIFCVRNLTQKLSDFFVVFEREPMGQDHAKLERDLVRLAFAAYDLRELLVPSNNFYFSYYLPLCRPGSSRQLEFLGERVNILETLGSTHRADSSADILYMTLCGGVVRSVRTKKVDGLRLPTHQNIVECQAVGVAWRPAEGEILSPWANHLTHDEPEREALEKASTLEKVVSRTWSGVKECDEDEDCR